MKTMKFFEIVDEKVKNFFVSLAEAENNEILLKAVLTETLSENGVELVETDDCNKSNFKVISSFGGKKGCTINVFPAFFGDEIIGAVAVEKERCSLLSLGQYSNYHRTYENQKQAFDWVI